MSSAGAAPGGAKGLTVSAFCWLPGDANGLSGSDDCKLLGEPNGLGVEGGGANGLSSAVEAMACIWKGLDSRCTRPGGSLDCVADATKSIAKGSATGGATVASGPGMEVAAQTAPSTAPPPRQPPMPTKRPPVPVKPLTKGSGTDGAGAGVGKVGLAAFSLVASMRTLPKLAEKRSEVAVGAAPQHIIPLPPAPKLVPPPTGWSGTTQVGMAVMTCSLGAGAMLKVWGPNETPANMVADAGSAPDWLFAKADCSLST